MTESERLAIEHGYTPEQWRAAKAIEHRIFGPYQWQNQCDRAASMFVAILRALKEESAEAEATIARLTKERDTIRANRDAIARGEQIAVMGWGQEKARADALADKNAKLRAALAEALDMFEDEPALWGEAKRRLRAALADAEDRS